MNVRAYIRRYVPPLVACPVTRTLAPSPGRLPRHPDACPVNLTLAPSPGRVNELKHFFDRLAEHVRNPERDLERRRILAALDRVDRLPGNADLVCELLLRHFVMMEPQGPYPVADVLPRLRHVQTPRR